MGRRYVQARANIRSPIKSGAMDGKVHLLAVLGNSNTRLIYLSGDVTEESIAAVQQQIIDLASKGKQPIHLVISTYGGAVHEMFSLYDVMKFEQVS